MSARAVCLRGIDARLVGEHMIHHVSIGTNDVRPAADCGWRRSGYPRDRAQIPPASLRNLPQRLRLTGIALMEEETMDGLIYLIGLIVVIMAILSFFGLR
jgi:hypothetical protein